MDKKKENGGAIRIRLSDTGIPDASMATKVAKQPRQLINAKVPINVITTNHSSVGQCPCQDAARMTLQDSPPKSPDNIAITDPDIYENICTIIKNNPPIEWKSMADAGFEIIEYPQFSIFYTNIVLTKRVKDNRLALFKKVVISKLPRALKAAFREHTVRIMRFLGTKTSTNKQCLDYFVRVYEIFESKPSIFHEHENVIYIFMEYFEARTIYSQVKSVAQVRYRYIKLWTVQISSAITFLQGNGIAHRSVFTSLFACSLFFNFLEFSRSIRLDHILLDRKNNIKLISYTRTVFCYNPTTGYVIWQPKEPRVRKLNHLPAEVFSGSYDATRVDVWSLGVFIVRLSTKRHPFDPCRVDKTFANQWKDFDSLYRKYFREEMLEIVRNIFGPNRISQQEAHELLVKCALDVETDTLIVDGQLDWCERPSSEFESRNPMQPPPQPLGKDGHDSNDDGPYSPFIDT